jgi:hypothetical protein
MHPLDPVFLLLRRVTVLDFFCFQCVPMNFSMGFMSFQCIPQHAPHFLPYALPKVGLLEPI